MHYHEPADMTPDEVQAAIRRNHPDELLHVPLNVALNTEDRAWAEWVCIQLADHPHPTVRGNAVLGFGHIARRFGALDEARIAPILNAALEDPDPYVHQQAQIALDDIRQFCGW